MRKLEPRLNQMRDLAQQLSYRYQKEENVTAVLLFGSVATGDIHEKSDLDLVVVEDSDTENTERKQIEEQGFSVDLWKHSTSSYHKLFNTDWSTSEIFQRSMFLNILQNCSILYDKDQTVTNYKSKAMEWTWRQEYINYFLEKRANAEKYIESHTLDDFENILFLKSKALLDTGIDLMKRGKPISNRVKDLYLKSREQLQDNRIQSTYSRHPNHEELSELIPEAFSLFYKEVPDRPPFTELTDAEKHHSNNEDFLAAISLQNAAFYLGRFGLRARNIKLENRDYLFPETHIELVKKTKEHWKPFYEFNRKIHGLDRC